MSVEKSVQDIYKSYVATGSVKKLMTDIKLQGIQENDPRISQIAELSKERDQKDKRIDYDSFSKRSTNCSSLLRKFSERQFVIPHFEKFAKAIEDIYWKCKSNTSGTNSSDIPQLASVPDHWGVSICTIDGQRFQIGDSSVGFSIQNCSKPLTYAIAIEQLSPELVHKFVGQEPMGRMTNEMVLDYNKKPHNPLINSGAIVTASLVYTLTNVGQKSSMAEKFDMVKSTLEAAGGLESFGFDNAIYHAKKDAGDTNFALGYFLKEKNVFPEGTNMLESLDFYFQVNWLLLYSHFN